jgi:hypothetical protein
MDAWWMRDVYCLGLGLALDGLWMDNGCIMDATWMHDGCMYMDA